MKVALLTAGRDPHYALGLAPALASSGIELTRGPETCRWFSGRQPLDDRGLVLVISWSVHDAGGPPPLGTGA